MDCEKIIKLFPIVRDVRKSFEKKEIPKEELERLYSQYNQIDDVKTFIERARESFPMGNCGLASVYLQRFFSEGEVIRGFYGKESHTFLLLDQKIVVDITADQFGGPKVYVGPFCDPWKR